MSRLVPLTGLEIERQLFEQFGLVLEGEVHTTQDQKRVFLENTVVGSVYLGEVADEAAMIALLNTHARGCWPGDICIRTDENAVWLCISNNGGLVTDWVRVAYRASAEEEGHWEPVANGDPDNPEVIFAGGDIVMAFVET